MSSNWGKNLHLSIFGESHGAAIGAVLDGIPAGIPLDEEEIARFMARRAPGQGKHTTARKEADTPQIQSGFLNGRTTGTPLCAIIQNKDTRSGDYSNLSRLARPAHADYTGHIRYSGYNDIRGGGHFSARLTAPLVFAGAVAKQALAPLGIAVGAHIAAIHGVEDTPLDSAAVTVEQLNAITSKVFPVMDDHAGERMLEEIEAARMNQDSVGGIVACYAVGVPVGVGSPMFGGLENTIASILFGIPGVKGVEFGAGFGCAALTGSQNNDAMHIADGKVVSGTNNHGGILGGIASGMPIALRVAFKPTPSISQPQRTVDYQTMENATLEVKGRHDPCIVPRAVPCVEAAVALALLEQLLEGGNPHGFNSLSQRA